MREALLTAGHETTSTWLDEENYGLEVKTPKERRQVAIRDIEDVTFADRLVLIANPPGENSPGGRHVETGCALYAGKKVHVIGRLENVFHYHPLVTQHQTTQEFLEAIAQK